MAHRRSMDIFSAREAVSLNSLPDRSMEAKKPEARRKFVLGGAAAAPVRVTVSWPEAELIPLSGCLNLFPGQQLPPIVDPSINCSFDDESTITTLDKTV